MTKVVDSIFQDKEGSYWYEVKPTFYSGPFFTEEEATSALGIFNLGRKFLTTLSQEEQITMSEQQLNDAFDSWRNPS